MIASIAYMDPGNFATNIQGGAQFGYLLLWVVLLANLVAMLFQALSAKLGIVTGQSLAQLCRAHFPRPLVYAMWVASEVAAMATDLAESLGAAIGLSPAVRPAAAHRSADHLCADLRPAAAAGPRLSATRDGHCGVHRGDCLLLRDRAVRCPARLARSSRFHTVVPQLAGPDSVVLAVGIIGATVMPHAIYLHSSLTQGRMPARTDAERRRIIGYSHREVLIALGVAGLVNMAMLAMAASVFHEGHADVAAIETAYHTLKPLLGVGAAAVFMASLLASGLSSSVVGTMAGQTIMQDFVGFRIPLWVRRLATMVPAVIVVAIGANSTQALVLSQVVLSLVLPVPMIALLVLSGRRDGDGRLYQFAPDPGDRGGRRNDGAGAQSAAALADHGCVGVSFRFELTPPQELPWPVTPIVRRAEMPAEPTQARRFGKARTAQSGALHEDYVELISDLLANGGEARPTDIARRLGVSHATAIKTIGRLKREGLAVAKPYRGVFLTEAGERLAERVRARHRIVVDLLLAVGVPAEAAEQDAEGIEHHVSDTSLAAFGRFLRRRG